MRLVNMDVDQYGTNDRRRMGPLSPQLNAICGPRGSGKTTLLRWLRIVAQESLQTAPLPVSGAVELRNHGCEYRVTSDRNGRLRFDIVAPSVVHPLDERFRDRPAGRGQTMASEWTNLTRTQKTAFLGLAEASGLADTKAALLSLAQQLGISLDSARLADNHEALLERERQLTAQLRQMREMERSADVLRRRRDELQAELQSARTTEVSSPTYASTTTDQARLREVFLRTEQELSATERELESLDRSISSQTADLRMLEGSVETPVAESHFRQLQDLEQRLAQWRQTLRDLKSHRERIEEDVTEAQLDEQVGEQLSTDKNIDPRAAIRSLEARIINTQQQLDQLVHQYGHVPGYDYRTAASAMGTIPHDSASSVAQSGESVYRDSQGRTYINAGYPVDSSINLPETLRNMKLDLHAVCRELARQESKTATKTLINQTRQLRRCETELQQAIEKLIEERADLISRIAVENRLTIEELATVFGEWSQCRDHHHFEDLKRESLTSEVPPIERESEKTRIQSELEVLAKNKRQLELQREEIRLKLSTLKSQLREANPEPVQTVHYAQHRSLPIIQRDLDLVLNELHRHDERERLQAELAETRSRMQESGPTTGIAPGLNDVVNRHILGLMPAASSLQALEVPESIVRMAMRIAIIEQLARMGEPISLVLDDHLDHLSPDIQSTAIAYLSQLASQDQQVILLTADQRVADLVATQRGWVGYLGGLRADRDVNRQLSAVANDHEADKWYQPVVSKSLPAAGRDYYLTERSLIEDLPSIDPATAARCRSLGVDRIGDLLDVDAHWLYESLQLRDLDVNDVIDWQSKASLLCEVKGLRPFDARVLVGCGIRSSHQLAAMHPSDLLDLVEDFLTTDRGRRILRSGDSYELSRMTTWIAAAKSDSRSGYTERYPTSPRGGNTYRSSRSSERGNGYRSSSRSMSQRSSGSRSRRSERRSDRSDRPDPEYRVVGKGRNGSRSWESRTSTESSRTAVVSKAETVASNLRFYLELSSPVVDAPSIGPRMAERLEQQGIYTVDQLLAADAAAIADKLDLRRVSEETVIAWQQQARLVCRIPNLRGHDAQLLVACELTTPEEISAMDATTLLSQVTVIAESKEGQKILRGGKEPDLEEVTDWIAWAAENRALSAA